MRDTCFEKYLKKMFEELLKKLLKLGKINSFELKWLIWCGTDKDIYEPLDIYSDLLLEIVTV